MKVTRSTGVIHFKNDKEGYLVNKHNTKVLVKDLRLNFNLSLQNQLIRRITEDKKKKQKSEAYTYLNHFIKYLIDNKKDKKSDMLKNLRKTFVGKNGTLNNSEIDKIPAKEYIKFALTNKGQNFEDTNKTKLYDLIYTVIEDESIKTLEELDVVLQPMRDTIKEKINRKRNRLEKSITNNKILYKVENGKLLPNTDRTKWLMGFIDAKNKKIKENEIFSLANNYKVHDLSKNLKESLKENDKNLKFKIKNTLRNHLNELRLNNINNTATYNIKHIEYYHNEVCKYFENHFPLKGKKTRNPNNYYFEETNIQYNVKKQIMNRIMSSIILQGKLIHYNYENKKWKKESFDSKDLQSIQIEEAFKKQILQAVIFGSNRLAFFLDYKETDDITNAKPFKEALKKYDNSVKIRVNNFINIESDEVKNFLCYLHKGITNTRINTYHYNKQFEGLCCIKDDEEKDEKKGNIDFNQKIKDIFKNDINEDTIKKQFAAKVDSMNLSLFYEEELINQVLSKCKFSFKNLLTNMRPSFNKVFKKGQGLYNHNKNKDFDWYINENVYTQENTPQLAYKNLLQLLYQYYFIPSLAKGNLNVVGSSEDNFNKKFHCCMKRVIEINENSNKHHKKKEKYKYNQIKKFIKEIEKEATTNYNDPNFITNILSNIQGKVIKEELRQKEKEKEKENNSNEKDKDNNNTNKFNEYVLDVFALCFNNFLNDRFDNNIKKQLTAPEPPNINDKDKNINDKVKTKNNLLGSININSSLFENDYITNFKYYDFYFLLRIIGKKSNNELKNQFVKYGTYLTKNDLPTKTLTLDTLLQLMDMVNLTYPDTINFELQNQKSNSSKLIQSASLKEYENIKNFVEGDITNYVGLYVQEDGKTPITHKGIMEVIKNTGNLSFYEKANKNKIYYIKKHEYETYKLMGNDIEDKQKQLKKLHNEFIEYKKDNTLNKPDIKKYKKLVEDITKYNQLKNKLTFTDISNMYHIHMSILSRFIGFVQDFEKDMLYFLTYFDFNGYFLNINCANNSNVIEKIFGEGAFVGKVNHYLRCGQGKVKKCRLNEKCNINKNLDKNKEFRENIFNVFYPYDKDTMQIRNSIAHLSPLMKQDISIIDIVNKCRILLSYDTKKKNAVTKAFKDLLAKENIEITLIVNKTNKKDFEIKEVKPKSVQHLKFLNSNKEKIETPYYSEEFIKLFKEVLQHKDGAAKK